MLQGWQLKSRRSPCGGKVPVEKRVWGIAAGTGRGAAIDGRGGGGGDGAVRRGGRLAAEQSSVAHSICSWLWLSEVPRVLASTATPHPLPNEFGWAPPSFLHLAQQSSISFSLVTKPPPPHTIRTQLHPGTAAVRSQPMAITNRRRPTAIGFSNVKRENLRGAIRKGANLDGQT